MVMNMSEEIIIERLASIDTELKVEIEVSIYSVLIGSTSVMFNLQKDDDGDLLVSIDELEAIKALKEEFPNEELKDLLGRNDDPGTL